MMLNNIVVGKRYRLNIRPNPEYRAPCCGTMLGVHLLLGHVEEVQGGIVTRHVEELQGAIVTVLGRSTRLLCPGCGALFPSPEGVWRVNLRMDGVYYAWPYTWLEPLEDEDYGEVTP